jgi:hypothetical protein
VIDGRSLHCARTGVRCEEQEGQAVRPTRNGKPEPPLRNQPI